VSVTIAALLFHFTHAHTHTHTHADRPTHPLSHSPTQNSAPTQHSSSVEMTGASYDIYQLSASYLTPSIHSCKQNSKKLCYTTKCFTLYILIKYLFFQIIKMYIVPVDMFPPGSDTQELMWCLVQVQGKSRWDGKLISIRQPSITVLLAAIGFCNHVPQVLMSTLLLKS
jgi:hypothetical protein